MDEDCIRRVGGRQGKERGKKVRKTGPVPRLLAHRKGEEGDGRARGGEGTSMGLPEVTSMEQMSTDIYVCKIRALASSA